MKFWKILLLAILSLILVLGCNTLNQSADNLSKFSNSSNCGSASGGETDNPIANYYDSNTYPWTQQIKWQCVYNINDFSGKTVDQQFENARDAAAEVGGGIVYFPAGIYEFKNNLYLKNGVVLRGETPTNQDAKSNLYVPPTKLVFPQYKPQITSNGTDNQTAFKQILTTSPHQDSNIGLVNLDLNRAGIELGANVDLTENENIIVFGIRSNNVAEPDPKVPDLSFQQPWMRYSYRFAANIRINAFQNILVANNRLNDKITDNYEQPGYQVKTIKGDSIITYEEGNQVPFNYTNHYGIVVNRSKDGGFKPGATPTQEPGLFRSGVVIRDNWVYHTMRVGISASGQGLIVQDNEIRDEARKQWWTNPTGLKQPRGAVTLENRAIDWSGWDVKITGNNYQVYRHRVMDTNYFSVDGEGILVQECCGGTTVKGAVISNNQGNAYIGVYKIPAVENVLIADNNLVAGNGNKHLIYVSADTNNAPHQMNNVRIENNTIEGGILAKASLGGSGNMIINNQGNGRGKIVYSCHIQLEANRRFREQSCEK